MQIVVSLHKEDPSWISEIPSHWDVIVYSKNHDLLMFPKKKKHDYRMISLGNIGRESHTYFHHIITNYHKLHDVTMFLQGNPFDHVPHLKEILKEKTIEGISKHQQSKNIVIPNYVGLGVCYRYEKIQRTLEFIKMKATRGHIFLVEEQMKTIPMIWNNFHKMQMPECLWSTWGNQFVIQKDLVLAFSKKTYQNAQLIHRKFASTPYAVEKALPEIFLNAHKKKLVQPSLNELL